MNDLELLEGTYCFRQFTSHLHSAQAQGNDLRRQKETDNFGVINLRAKHTMNHEEQCNMRLSCNERNGHRWKGMYNQKITNKTEERQNIHVATVALMVA